MTDLVQNIFNYRILVCTSKRDRLISLKASVEALQYEAVVCRSLYEAKQYLAQDIPHLVFSDVTFDDGHIGHLQDALQASAELKEVPIFALPRAKTPEELAPLKARKFSGIILGDLKVDQLMETMLGVLNTFNGFSPHLVPPTELGLEKNSKLILSAKMLAGSADFLIIESDLKINNEAKLSCHSQGDGDQTMTLVHATNLPTKEGFFNVFPVRSIRGQGRKLISSLPQVKMGNNSGAKVLAHRLDAEGLEMDKLLLASDLKVDNVDSWPGFFDQLKEGNKKWRVAMVDCRDDKSKIAECLKVVQSMPPSTKVPLIIISDDYDDGDFVGIKILKYPFGVETLMNNVQASLLTAAQIDSEIKMAEESNKIAVMEIQVELIGMDETGGVLKTTGALQPGVQIRIDHAKLAEFWGVSDIYIKAVSRSKSVPNEWYIQFECLTGGSSRLKYFQNLLLHFGENMRLAAGS